MTGHGVHVGERPHVVAEQECGVPSVVAGLRGLAGLTGGVYVGRAPENTAAPFAVVQVNNNGKERAGARTPMQWNSSENAGFTTGTPWIGVADNYKAINAADEVDDPDSVRSFYKMLVHLRKTHKVISEGKIEFLYPDNADLLAYRRYGAEDGEELLVLCNLTEHDAPYTLPEGWADADKLLGNYPDRNDALRPYECLILIKA